MLGLIDNQGIANSLSQKIQAASRATGQARRNILNAFKNEVLAQSGKSDNCEQQGEHEGQCPGKHFTGVAVQVLLEDADSLLSQLQ